MYLFVYIHIFRYHAPCFLLQETAGSNLWQEIELKITASDSNTASWMPKSAKKKVKICIQKDLVHASAEDILFQIWLISSGQKVPV